MGRNSEGRKLAKYWSCVEGLHDLEAGLWDTIDPGVGRGWVYSNWINGGNELD